MIPADKKTNEAMNSLMGLLTGVKIQRGTALDLTLIVGPEVRMRIEYRQDASDPLGGWWMDQIPS